MRENQRNGKWRILEEGAPDKISIGNTRSRCVLRLPIHYWAGALTSNTKQPKQLICYPAVFTCSKRVGFVSWYAINYLNGFVVVGYGNCAIVIQSWKVRWKPDLQDSCPSKTLSFLGVE